MLCCRFCMRSGRSLFQRTSPILCLTGRSGIRTVPALPYLVAKVFLVGLKCPDVQMSRCQDDVLRCLDSCGAHRHSGPWKPVLKDGFLPPSLLPGRFSSVPVLKVAEKVVQEKACSGGQRRSRRPDILVVIWWGGSRLKLHEVPSEPNFVPVSCSMIVAEGAVTTHGYAMIMYYAHEHSMAQKLVATVVNEADEWSTWKALDHGLASLMSCSILFIQGYSLGPASSQLQDWHRWCWRHYARIGKPCALPPQNSLRCQGWGMDQKNGNYTIYAYLIYHWLIFSNIVT